MRREEIWSIHIRRIEDFFLSQPDTEKIPGGFRVRRCSILLMDLPPAGESIWKTCRTKVIFSGEDADTSVIYHRFFIHFLSAGG